MTAEIIMLKDRRKPTRLPPVTMRAEHMLKEARLEHDVEDFSQLSDDELFEFRQIFSAPKPYVPQAPAAKVAFSDAMVLASPETRAKIGRILDELEAVLDRRQP